MTDPTPEQVEAAAEALYQRKTGRTEGFGQTLFRETWRQSARAALVAAAGVTPQESCGINLFRDLGYDEASPEVIAAREAVARECANQVQVDEAKLAEIARRVDLHEWSRMGGSQGEQVADIVRDVLGGGGE